MRSVPLTLSIATAGIQFKENKCVPNVTPAIGITGGDYHLRPSKRKLVYGSIHPTHFVLRTVAPMVILNAVSNKAAMVKRSESTKS